MSSGCADGIPTSNDPGQLPIETTTFEVRLPFSAFASDFRLFTGYGVPHLLPEAIIAGDWGGIDSQAMLRFGALPSQIFVIPPGGSATVADSLYTPVSSTVELQIDTALVRGTGRLSLEAGAIGEAWDHRSADWQFAVDTVGMQVPWSAPGGGVIDWFDEAVLDPAVPPDPVSEEEGEETLLSYWTVRFDVDSATTVRWTEQERPDRGLAVAGRTPESRLRLVGARLLVNARSSINPDTIVAIPVGLTEKTFLYTPETELSPEAFPIGGSPGTRATFRLEMPESVPGDPAVCQLVSCPVELLPDRIVYAGLELHTREADPAGFRPLRSTVVELRPVLAPDRLPRSPLAVPVSCPSGACPTLLPSTEVEEGDFIGGGERSVALPLTRYVRDLLQDPGTQTDPVPSTLALLFGIDPSSRLEMRPLQQATFWGPGTSLEPTLRLILTVSDGVPLP